MPSDQPPPPSTPLRRLISLDTALSLHLYTLLNPILPYPFLKLLEYSGDGRLFFPIVLSLLFTTTPPPLCTPLSASTLLLSNLLLGALLDLILIGLLKHIVKRPRPVYNKNMFLSFSVDHWSFPSGHSSRVWLIATVFCLYSDQEKKGVVSAVKVWAAMTAASRVVMGRHFVMDVVCGACLGVVEGFVVFWFLNYRDLCSLYFDD